VDGRQQRGMQIAAIGGARIEGGSWRVDSQTGPGRKYRVNPRAESCTCPDHEATNARCKHVWAVVFTMTATETPEGTVTTARVTYAQDWPSYNRAQVEEKESFMRLLADLCASIPQPPQAKGRPRLPLGDMVFAACFKVFSGYSSRRFSSDLRDAHEKGLISRVPHFNSVTNYLANEELTPLLQDLIAESALPLRALESDFAVDSTGFTTSRFMKWLDEKHGIATSKRQREWLKAHVMVGVRTNVVTAVEISGGFGADTTYFDPLVRNTAKDWDMEEVSADKAYLTKRNCELVEEIGATPFVPFKSNTKPVLGIGSAWARMYHRFASEPEKFMGNYHKRSNVETTFSMIKGKFGDSVMSKSPVGQANEVLCKVLAHNIVCVAQAAIEFGIDTTFAQ
jgi:Transposase DDE domain